MRRFLVLCAVKGQIADGVQTVDMVHIFQVRLGKGALSKVYIDSVKLPGKIGVVGPAAAHGTNAFQTVVILYQGHVPVHASLHRRLIDHPRPVNAVLGPGFLVIAHHHSRGPAVSLGGFHHLAGQIAANHTVFLCPFLRKIKCRQVSGVLLFCLRVRPDDDIGFSGLSGGRRLLNRGCFHAGFPGAARQKDCCRQSCR